MRIVNLTQHAASTEQLAAGVSDVEDREALSAFLTFSATMLAENPSIAAQIVEDRARDIVRTFVAKADAAMIGGAPYLMAPLERALQAVGCPCLYAISDRVSEDQVQADGSTRKVAVFKHVGFLRTRTG